MSVRPIGRVVLSAVLLALTGSPAFAQEPPPAPPASGAPVAPAGPPVVPSPANPPAVPGPPGPPVVPPGPPPLAPRPPTQSIPPESASQAPPPPAAAPLCKGVVEPAPRNDREDRSETRWYNRLSKDPKPKFLAPYQEAVSVLVDSYGWTGGSLRGSGGSIRADIAAGSPWVGVFGGVSLNNGWPIVGFDVFRYPGALKLFSGEGLDLRVVNPHAEVGFVVPTSSPTLTGVTASTQNSVSPGVIVVPAFSPGGLRVTYCPLNLVADLRPTVGFWVGTATHDQVSPAIGVQLSIGYFFEFAHTATKAAKSDEDDSAGPQEDDDESGGAEVKPKKKKAPKKPEADDDEAMLRHTCPAHY